MRSKITLKRRSCFSTRMDAESSTCSGAWKWILGCSGFRHKLAEKLSSATTGGRWSGGFPANTCVTPEIKRNTTSGGFSPHFLADGSFSAVAMDVPPHRQKASSPLRLLWAVGVLKIGVVTWSLAESLAGSLAKSATFPTTNTLSEMELIVLVKAFLPSLTTQTAQHIYKFHRLEHTHTHTHTHRNTHISLLTRKKPTILITTLMVYMGIFSRSAPSYLFT